MTILQIKALITAVIVSALAGYTFTSISNDADTARIEVNDDNTISVVGEILELKRNDASPGGFKMNTWGMDNYISFELENWTPYAGWLSISTDAVGVGHVFAAGELGSSGRLTINQGANSNAVVGIDSDHLGRPRMYSDYFGGWNNIMMSDTKIKTAKDIEFSNAASSIIIMSPDGHRFKVKVDDNGVLRAHPQ